MVNGVAKPDYLTDDEWRRAQTIIKLLAERDRIIYGSSFKTLEGEWIPAEEFTVPITAIGALMP